MFAGFDIQLSERCGPRTSSIHERLMTCLPHSGRAQKLKLSAYIDLTRKSVGRLRVLMLQRGTEYHGGLLYGTASERRTDLASPRDRHPLTLTPEK
jgi:hypothetical protein